MLNMKALKVYVITLSQTFPVGHPRAGKPTYFEDKFKNARYDATHIDEHTDAGLPNYDVKLHTLRGNWELWHKRFEDIYAGKACLSVRIWSGKPYNSKQIEIARLTKEDGINVQLCCFPRDRDGMHSMSMAVVNGNKYVDGKELAKKDGLSYDDWKAWIRGYNLDEPLAIINLVNHRY